jgi:hypothetical protein
MGEGVEGGRVGEGKGRGAGIREGRGGMGRVGIIIGLGVTIEKERIAPTGGKGRRPNLQLGSLRPGRA